MRLGFVLENLRYLRPVIILRDGPPGSASGGISCFLGLPW